MPELIAKAAFAETARLELAGIRLEGLASQPAQQIAFYPGGAEPGAALLAGAGFTMPAPGCWTGDEGQRLIWNGRDRALLIGGLLPDALAGALADHAALSGQSGGYAGVSLSGQGAEEVLAQLVGPDLRARVFGPGSAMRSPLNHMPCLILRVDAGFELYVFRSMARSAWHELEEALQRYAARQAARA